MKEYTTDKIRNVALTGHSGSGKTSLAEAIAYQMKIVDRMGRTDEGNTLCDYDEEEHKRQISINASLMPVEYNDCKINLLDTPGYRDFIGETKNALRVSDGMVLVLDATAGIEVGAELAWEYADEYNLPRAVFINKLDKEHTDFAVTLNKVEEGFSGDFVVLTLPIGKTSSFSGIVDVLKMKSVTEKDRKASYGEVPEDMKSMVEDYRKKLVELAAEGDDELTMKFLEEETLTEDEIALGLKTGISAGKLIPVLCGSATASIGITPLLDLIAGSFPSPLDTEGFKVSSPEEDKEIVMTYKEDEPFTGFVFKTISDAYAGRLTFFKVLAGSIANDSLVYNLNKGKEEKITHLLSLCGKKQENVHKIHAGDFGAVSKLSVTATNDTLNDSSKGIVVNPTVLPSKSYSMAIKAKSKGEEEKIGILMHKMIEQDPTLEMRRNPEIRQTILSGMGNIHLDVAVSRLKSSANVEIELETPRVAYRETITRKAEGQGKFKKQSGGRGQYGDCWLRLEPNTRGAGYEFEWEIVGGVIPTKYQVSVDKGVQEAMEKGVVSGYPVVDVKVACYDGSYHSVDSSDIAFKVAASMGFQSVAMKADPVILEPIMNVKVTVPESYMGDIMGDMSGRRGKIMGSDQQGKKVVINALVPQGEMFTYSQDLNSMTQGRGIYETLFSTYERVPGEIQEKIIEEAKARKETEE